MKLPIQVLTNLLASEMDYNEIEKLVRVLITDGWVCPTEKELEPFTKTEFPWHDYVFIFVPDLGLVNDNAYTVHDGAVWADGDLVCQLDDVFVIIHKDELLDWEDY